jgi:hypothetical protein
VLGTEFNIQSLRARRQAQVRHAAAKSEVSLLLKTVQAQEDFAVSLAGRLLYGCDLRVRESLELRIKDG